MSSVGARTPGGGQPDAGGRSATAGHGHGHHDDDRVTPAQWFCRLAGPVLVLAGLAGFIVDATFDTASGDASTKGGLQGDSLLGFEVNGWHNIVHLATGLLLLLGAKKGLNASKLAKTVVLIFALGYALVTIIGLIDGTDVLGLIPVNPADNVLHIVLTIAALAAALASRTTRDDAPAQGRAATA